MSLKFQTDAGLMNAQIKIKKIQRNLNDYGFSITLEKIISNLIKPVYENRTYRIYRLELDEFHNIPSQENSFIYKIINKNDTSIIKQIEDMEEWLQGKVNSMLEDGDLCLVALDGEKVAGFNLVSFGEVFIPLINHTRKLRHKEAWSSQITVNKNYRRKGLGTALRHRIIEKLKKRGIEKLYGGTLIANEPNLKLSRKVGFKEIIDVQYLKILNKENLRYIRVKKD